MATGYAVKLLGNTAKLIFTNPITLVHCQNPLNGSLFPKDQILIYFPSLSSTFSSKFLLFSLMSPIISLVAAHAHGAPFSTTPSPPFPRVNFFIFPEPDKAPLPLRLWNPHAGAKVPCKNAQVSILLYSNCLPHILPELFMHVLFFLTRI